MRFERYLDVAGEWRWRAIAANGKLVGDSGQGYLDERDLDNGIDLFRTEAATAEVVTVADTLPEEATSEEERVSIKDELEGLVEQAQALEQAARAAFDEIAGNVAEAGEDARQRVADLGDEVRGKAAELRAALEAKREAWQDEPEPEEPVVGSE